MYVGKVIYKIEVGWPVSGHIPQEGLHENLSTGSGIVPCRRTNGHDEVNEPLFAILRTRLKMMHLGVAQGPRF